MTARPSLPARAVDAGVLAFYLVLAVAVFASVWVDPGGRWIGEAKDPRLFIWYLGYVPGHLPALLTPDLNAPFGVNLMWNTSLIAPAVALWPVTAAFGPVVAYNALITVGVALSAWLAYLAAGRFVGGSGLRMFAGAVYGFSPAVIAQATRHAHVAVALFPPIALLIGHQILVRRRHPLLAGVAAGAACFVQLLISEEMLALTALAVLGGLSLAAPWRSAAAVRRLAVAGAATVVTFAVLAAYPVWFQFLGPQRAFGSLQPQDVYVNDLLALAVPNFNAAGGGLASWLVDRFTGNSSEDNAYVGLPLLVLFAVAAWGGRHDRAIRWAAGLAVGLFVLSLGPHLHVAGYVSPVPLPWLLFGRLPLFESADPARIMLIGYLPLALAVARWADGRTRSKPALAGLALALLLLVPTAPFPSTPAQVPAFFRPGGAAGRLPAGANVLVTPFSSKESTEAMYWQAVAGYRFRMPEGDAFTPGPTLGPRPSLLRQRLEALDRGSEVPPPADDRDELLRELLSLGVSTVVSGPSPGQARIVAYLSVILGRPPLALEGVEVWLDCCPASQAAAAQKSTTPAG